jgi:heme/copper-type cytochrome/quinol oxidase subunit 2
MQKIMQHFRCFLVACFTLVLGLASQSAAMAAPPPPPPPAQEVSSGTYVMLYFLVIFGIALGMICVCRPVNRRERARTEQFADKE